MADKMLVAVPSTGEGGIDAERSPHFGRCESFTIVEVTQDGIGYARALPNPRHEQGGCMAPVDMLAAEGVDAVLVRGIGDRPLERLRAAGIDVLCDRTATLVGDAVSRMIAGDVEKLEGHAVCGGNDGRHGHGGGHGH